MSRKQRRRQLTTKSAPPYAPGGQGFTPPQDWPVGWWQQAYRTPLPPGNAAVEACVGAISQTVASLPIHHWRELPSGEQQKVRNSAASRVLRRPNNYQTRADFILNLLRSELLSGNGVAVATRNGRFEIDSLHLVNGRSAQPYVADDGSIFYSVGTNDVMPDPPIENMWPSRDVLHIRMHTPRHPLVGETPITSAAMSVSAGNSIAGHMSAFFENMARPSGYLSVPGSLKPEVAAKLREEWNNAYSARGSGRIAALQGGVEWKALAITSVDAQLIESYRMTIADVARVYRVPLTIVGDTANATYGSTESLINHWLSTGLGYVLEHLELALDAMFELPPDEFTAFDVEYLMRTDFKTRIEGLVRGVQGGVYAPNEARIKEGLKPVDFGDEPRVQAQVVPLSYAGVIPAAPSASTTPSAPGTPTPDDDDDDDEEDEEAEEAPEQTEEERRVEIENAKQKYLRILFNA